MPGTLLFLNDTQSISPGAAAELSFAVPQGGVVQWLSTTRQLRVDSDEIEVVRVRFLPLDRSRDEDVLDLGDPIGGVPAGPNIKEFAGTGQLPRIMTVQEYIKDDSELLVTVRNQQSAGDVEVSMTCVFKLLDEAEQPPAEKPRLRIINDVQEIASGAEANFVVRVPEGNTGLFRELTGFLFDTVAGTAGSDDVFVERIKVVMEGETQPTDLLGEGEMNFNELFGNAEFVRIMELVQRLRYNSPITFRIRNDDANQMRISTTAWLETVQVFPAPIIRGDAPQEVAGPIRRAAR